MTSLFHWNKFWTLVVEESAGSCIREEFWTYYHRSSSKYSSLNISTHDDDEIPAYAVLSQLGYKWRSNSCSSPTHKIISVWEYLSLFSSPLGRWVYSMSVLENLVLPQRFVYISKNWQGDCFYKRHWNPIQQFRYFELWVPRGQRTYISLLPFNPWLYQSIIRHDSDENIQSLRKEIH